MSKEGDAAHSARCDSKSNQDKSEKQAQQSTLFQHFLIVHNVKERKAGIAEQQMNEMVHHSPSAGAVNQQHRQQGQEDHHPKDDFVPLE